MADDIFTKIEEKVKNNKVMGSSVTPTGRLSRRFISAASSSAGAISSTSFMKEVSSNRC